MPRVADVHFSPLSADGEPDSPLLCPDCGSGAFNLFDSGHAICVECGEPFELHAGRRIYGNGDEESEE